MKMVMLDTEQVSLLREGADAVSRLLGMRLERADPDHVISNSLDLQQSKLDQVLSQLDLPPLPDWSTIPKDRRARILKLCAAMGQVNTEQLRGQVFTSIVGEFLASREETAHATNERKKLTASASIIATPEDEGKGVG